MLPYQRNINHSTLVLNSDGNPISIIPLSVIGFKEAIRLIISERVVPLDLYDGWTVHSQKLAISVPSVVMTKKYIKNCQKIRFSKENVFWRDENCCQYCGNTFDQKDLTLAHVVPKSLGGKRSFDNICTACVPCNWERGELPRPKGLWLPASIFQHHLNHLIHNDDLQELHRR